MKYLKSHLAWPRWCSSVFGRQEVDEPKEYPCYVYTVVASWGMQEEQPVYVYRRDLEKMLKAIEEK